MDPKVLDCLRRGNPVVFFDISIGGSPSGRIRLELFKNICPKVGLCVVLFTLQTVENFRYSEGAWQSHV